MLAQRLTPSDEPCRFYCGARRTVIDYSPRVISAGIGVRFPLSLAGGVWEPSLIKSLKPRRVMRTETATPDAPPRWSRPACTESNSTFPAPAPGTLSTPGPRCQTAPGRPPVMTVVAPTQGTCGDISPTPRWSCGRACRRRVGMPQSGAPNFLTPAPGVPGDKAIGCRSEEPAASSRPAPDDGVANASWRQIPRTSAR